MPKFRKKPVVIEAEQFHDDRPLPFHELGIMAMDPDGFWFIETLEGRLRVSPGDWVIRGVAGEFYPCKPDIFDATYELVTGGG